MNSPLDSWCTLPTPFGNFRMYDSGDEQVRIVCFGDLQDQGKDPLLRIHSSCLASEVFGALDCDCADQLREAMKLIVTEGRGLIIHIHQEGRGHGLSKKIQAVSAMQQDNLDTVTAFEILGLEQDIRSYGSALRVLRQIGIARVRLISNNPRKIRYLQDSGIQVAMINTHPTIRTENAVYLQTKNAKLGHYLPLEVDVDPNSTIRFYHSDQPWGQLSNFSRHAIFLHGRVWPSVEHFYQAQKFAGMPQEELIRICSTPMLAKQRAIDFTPSFRRADWHEMKEKVMLAGLRAKFDQHPDLKNLLLSSGSRQLVEHTSQDAYWGDAGDGSGENRLGYLLMQVRMELKRSVVEETKAPSRIEPCVD